MKEIMRISYNYTYNTNVEYYGTRTDILDMLRLFDLWGSKGQYFCKGDLHNDTMTSLTIRSIDEPYDQKYRFELSKEFYDYAKTDDFARAMRRAEIELEIY